MKQFFFEDPKVSECLKQFSEYSPQLLLRYENEENSADFDEKIMEKQNQLKKSEEKLPITSDCNANSQKIDAKDDKEDKKQSIPLESQIVEPTQQRRVRKICCSKHIRQCYSKAIQGFYRQTENLGKNYKPILVNHLKLFKSRFKVQEYDSIKEFKSKNGGLNDLSELFKKQYIHIRQYSQGLLYSKDLPCRIMKSKMDLSNKLVLIKYMQRLIRITNTNSSRWKGD